MVDVTRDAAGQPVFSAEKEAGLKDAFYDMVCMMARLRKGCPWDREQTPESLRRYILEEAYEVLETIDDKDWPGLREELGDFVFQVAFQAQIQADEARFDFEDVLRGLVKKMVHRHPHVFAAASVEDADHVARNWEQLKQLEKGPQTSILDGLTRGMPALLEAFKVTKKAAKVGFDWDGPEQVRDKITEELAELDEAAHETPERVQEELGDLMFAVANLVRKHGFEPEETLRMANRKFIKRFKAMEVRAREQGADMKDLNLDQQEALWQAVKQDQRG